MPVLAAEPNVFPLDLFDDAALATDRVWRVLHSKPRQEKSLARQLLSAEIPFYLPLIHRRSLRRGRVGESYIPLFAGYVFLKGTKDERYEALKTDRIVRVLEVGNQDLLDRDLRQVHQLIAAGRPITPEDKLGPGMRVRICAGPLLGMEGKILRFGSSRKFVVEVDFIQKGAAVVLDDFCVQPHEVQELS